MRFYQEPNVTLYCGHALNELRDMPGESVDCAITSPPYWGLRTYKTEPIVWGDNHCEHEWTTENFRQHAGRGDCQQSKKYSAQGPIPDMVLKRDFCLKCNAWRGELGLEPTIELYIEHLILIFNEVKRVLKKTGTCWVNLDDSYAANRSYQVPDSKWCDVGNNMAMSIPSGIPPKSLCLIPQRFAIAMVENSWILRNDICWSKPNPMPESVKDRFTGSWEHLFFFVKNKRYWFEQQFEQYTEPLNRWGGDFTKPTDYSKDEEGLFAIQEREGRNRRPNELGRNKRDVWEITTQPYPEAHFAVYPEKLVETPILAGCPSMICKKCGKAREKIYANDKVNKYTEEGSPQGLNPTKMKWNDSHPSYNDRWWAETRIEGYTDCGCNAGFELGVVIDIFAGSGTTGAVAKRLGRKYIGIELNPDYCKLHVKRLQGIPLPMELV